MKFRMLFFLLFLYVQLFAQTIIPNTVTGNNPVNIQWKYIDSKAVKVIFPEGNEKEARRVANIITFISDSAGISVGEKRKHIDLVLQTNQAISNGYVALAPYRSEFYATGIQNFNWLGSPNWLDGLAFHEYRHALQFANGRRGLTKILYFLGGQNMWALAMQTAVPNWYLEGDAVQTETMFSGAGRGRTPYFFQEQRALLFNNRNYTYIKARNGSFKSLMPDHYRLGYAMLHQVRNEKGPDVWRKILKDGSGYRGLFYSFSRAMKRHSGYTSRRTYYRTYDTLRTTWGKELNTLHLIPTAQLSKQPKRYVTHYEWPYIQEDGSVICRKESYNRTQALVRIKDGKEKYLTSMGYTVTESYLSVNNNVAAWTEFTNDPRWLNKNYSDIHSYNLLTGEKKKVSSHSKLYSPQYSAKRNLFVAVKADESVKNTVVFINPENGQETGSISNPENDFLSYPKWTRDDGAVVYLAKKGHKIVMLKYELETKITTELTPLSQQIIESLSLGKDIVYFSASYSGINNVYAVSLNGDKVIRQITSVKVGANNPSISPDEKTLAMIELGYMGNAIRTQPVDLTSVQVIAVAEPENQSRYSILTTSVESKIYGRIPDCTFEVKNYSGPIRGAKLHSWNLSGNQVEVAAGIQVNNILNDFGAELNVAHNLNEGTNYVTGRIDYAKYYLPVSVSSAVNGRAVVQPARFNVIPKSGANIQTFTEAVYAAGLSLPLSWNHGIYTTRFRLYGNPALIKTSSYYYNDLAVNRNLSVNVLEGGFSFSNLRGIAKQNIFPRFGQSLSAYYGESVNGVTARKFQAQAAIYLPGLLRNHGLKFEGGYKNEGLANNYRFLDNFKHARGYIPIQGDQEIVFSTNYAMPLFYPDFGFGGLLYLKRVRANIFADLSKVTRTAFISTQTFDQNSAGVEVYFDTVIINSLPLSVGLRYASLRNSDYYNNTQKGSSLVIFFAGTF